MAADGDDDFFEQFKEGYDEFFEERPREAVASRVVSNGVVSAGVDIESEYAMLSQDRPRHDGGYVPQGVPQGGIKTFALDDDDNDDGDMDMVHSEYQQDCRAPALPNPPEDFSADDLRLREALAEFYMRYRAERLANINSIVIQYRGIHVSDLWVMLALKYRLEAPDVVELIARTLYLSAPFEKVDCTADVSEGGREPNGSRRAHLRPEDSQEAVVEQIRQSIVEASKDGSEEDLRMLCFRGMPADCELRPQVWKILLGYLPMARQSEWHAIQAAKRSLYSSYKSEFLVFKEGHMLEVNVGGHRVMDAPYLLEQIQKDVDRTRQNHEYFCRPSTRAALISLLFVYALLNPEVEYVQGMNEVAAVLLYIMSPDPDFAEADAFWCFSELMIEIKAGFMQSEDNSTGGINALVGHVDRMLKTYDLELVKHLHKACCPPSVFSFRWCSLLFAQDTNLPDVARLWDSLLADPDRFQLVVHTCVAAMLTCREQLLRTSDEGALGEIMRGALRPADFDALIKRTWAICALERRKQTPPFPVKSAAQLVQEISGFAQSAAVKAQEVLQQNIAPVVKERAGQALGIAAVAAHGGAQVVQAKLDQSAPSRHDALEKAQTTVASLWEAVKTKGANAKRSGVVDTAASASSAVYSRFASALAGGTGDSCENPPSDVPIHSVTADTIVNIDTI